MTQPLSSELDELERLQARVAELEAERQAAWQAGWDNPDTRQEHWDKSNELIWAVSRAEHELGRATARALPSLIAACRERDALRAEIERNREVEEAARRALRAALAQHRDEAAKGEED